jgi:hypothetical protein
MALKVPKLTKRLVKGTPLTNAEGDGNIDVIETFCNTLANIIAASLNPDGTLKTDSVLEASIKARQIGLSKLKLNFLPVGVDTGSAGNYSIAFNPALTAYEDGLVFLVRPLNGNQGASKLKVDALAYVDLVKNGGQQLDAGDIVAKLPFWVLYYGGQFHIVSGVGSTTGGGSSQTNFTGVVRYDPDAIVLPGAGNTATFTHVLGQYPTEVKVVLVCITSELGFFAGQEVPSYKFIDVNNRPAFQWTVDAADIKVTQLVSPPKIQRLDVGNVGVVGDITPGNWQLKVSAAKTFNETTQIFPALDVQVSNPDGALGYGNSLFFLNRGQNSGKTFINRLDLATNKISQISSIATMNQMNIAMFRLNTNEDRMVWTCDQGVFFLPLQDPNPAAWVQTEYGNINGGFHAYKPCDVDESTGVNTPIVYAVQSSSGAGTTTSIGCKKLNTSTNVTTDHGNPLSLHDNRITNYLEFTKWHSAASKILMFQYNPIKKRIYVITDETGFIHIFTVNNASFNAWWAAVDVTRYGQLTYEKAIGLGGGAGHWSNSSKDRFAVEFDLATGEEKSIAITRTDLAAFAGVITRAPWTER